jgi:hypothetical protein
VGSCGGGVSGAIFQENAIFFNYKMATSCL